MSLFIAYCVYFVALFSGVRWLLFGRLTADTAGDDLMEAIGVAFLCVASWIGLALLSNYIGQGQ